MGAVQKSRPPSECCGFTLIELSVVLVIIGLIVGGVLVGRDLIHAAELRSVVSQLEQFETAVGAFRLKFNCLPGDCVNADAFGFADAGCTTPYPCPDDNTTQVQHAGCNGNGNERLDNEPYLAAMCPENLNFWYHLHLAALIGGSYDGKSTTESTFGPENRTPIYGVSAPATRLRGVGVLTRLDGYLIGWDDAGHLLSPGAAQLYTDEAAYIDGKLDDGLPLAGRIQYAIASNCAVGAGDSIFYNTADRNARCAIAMHITGFGSP